MSIPSSAPLPPRLHPLFPRRIQKLALSVNMVKQSHPLRPRRPRRLCLPESARRGSLLFLMCVCTSLGSPSLSKKRAEYADTRKPKDEVIPNVKCDPNRGGHRESPSSSVASQARPGLWKQQWNTRSTRNKGTQVMNSTNNVFFSKYAYTPFWRFRRDYSRRVLRKPGMLSGSSLARAKFLAGAVKSILS